MARILVIEDDDQMRGVLRGLLEHACYEVTEASNGREGVELCRQESFDLVITDIIMPEREGLETIRELTRTFPEIKIIAISGRGLNYLRMAEEFGALRTFTKPFKGEEILKAAGELLGEDR